MGYKFIGDFYFTNEADANEADIEELMSMHYAFFVEFQQVSKYVTSSSVLMCSAGTQLSLFDVPVTHGVQRTSGDPIGICSDCKVNQNIYSFGGCSRPTPAGYPERKSVVVSQSPSRISEKDKCIPMLNNTGWQHTKTTLLKIWDYKEQKYYDALTTGDFLTCFYGGIIRVAEVPGKISTQDCIIRYLSDEYMDWLELAEGCTLYPYADTADNSSAKARKSVTLGIGYTFDIQGEGWDILKEVLNWSDSDLKTIANGVYSGVSYQNSSQYAITHSQAREIFRRAAIKQYMPELNDCIQAFNNQNGSIAAYTQRELEAMFDYAYNSGLSPTKSTGYAYSDRINDQDTVIYYYLRKNLAGAASAVKKANTVNRRRVNQMNLFFYDYTFTDVSPVAAYNNIKTKLGL